MFPERSLKSDLAAVVILAVGFFLALALLSFDPADPPSRLVYPPNPSVSNWCGSLGARVSHWAFGALGIGAYYLVASLLVFSGYLLSRDTPSQPVMRSCGWLVSLLGVVTFAALAMPGCARGTVIGPGGYLGAVTRGLIESQCATMGAYLLAASLVVGGLLLATDYLLIWLLLVVTERPTRLAGTCVRQLAQLLPNKREAATGEDQPGATRDDHDREEEIDIPIKRRTSENEDPLSTNPAGELQADRGRLTEAATANGGAGSTDEGGELRIQKPRKTERQLVIAELDAASRAETAFDYELPSLDLLLDSEPFSFEEQEKDVRRKAKILEKTFANFGFRVKVVEVETGPVIAQFEVELEAGLRLSKITSLSEDLAIALRVPSVRIVAPIPGKNTVGIEVPNAERQLVRLREVIEESNGKAAKMRIPIYLGKDVSGKPILFDLSTLPHLLIAGRTGTGKSVCLNTIIMSMLMTRSPDDVRMLLIDPKMVELSSYMKLPHLMHPVVTDMRKAEAILGWAVEKMEERYALLARAGVRHISVYNQLGEEELFERLQPESEEERKLIPTHLPYIVIVADEMADLMMTAAKEVEAHIIRLAQKSRAVGIHLVLATQKPTVDVITGLIKSNLPARIAFQVASRTDSRVVLDEMGADKLLGNGDMLFLWPGTSTLLRGQGAYVSDDEIARVVNFAGQHEPQFVSELIQLKPAAQDGPQGRGRHDDDLFEAAVDIVIREGRGSVSLLQRSLGIGYGRAARLIDYMAEDGIVGQYNGSQAREVLVSMEGWRQMMGEDNGAKPADAAAVRSRLPARDVMTSTRDEPRRPAVPARPARLAADWSDEDQEDNEDDVLAEDDLEEETNDVIEQDVEDVDDSVDEQSDDEPSIAPWEPRRGEAESRRRRRPSA